MGICYSIRKKNITIPRKTTVSQIDSPIIPKYSFRMDNIVHNKMLAQVINYSRYSTDYRHTINTFNTILYTTSYPHPA